MDYLEDFRYGEDILFKAISKEKREWVEGLYINIQDKNKLTHYITRPSGEKIEIWHSTLSIFTNMIDVDNVKIFTNDIIQCNPDIIDPVRDHIKFESAIDQMSGEYIVSDDVNSYDPDVRETPIFTLSEVNNIKVVGNRYDDAKEISFKKLKTKRQKQKDRINNIIAVVNDKDDALNVDYIKMEYNNNTIHAIVSIVQKMLSDIKNI
jgi:hypothetical protein